MPLENSEIQHRKKLSMKRVHYHQWQEQQRKSMLAVDVDESRPRTIFHRAIECFYKVSWEDPLLRYILSHDGEQCRLLSIFHPITNECEPPSEATVAACTRVETLHAHGWHAEAVRLAAAVVRSLRCEQKEWESRSSISLAGAQVPNDTEGWIGHPSEPIDSLFNVLAEKSLKCQREFELEEYYEPTYTCSQHTCPRI